MGLLVQLLHGCSHHLLASSRELDCFEPCTECGSVAQLIHSGTQELVTTYVVLVRIRIQRTPDLEVRV
jgi:hypothetical protein